MATAKFDTAKMKHFRLCGPDVTEVPDALEQALESENDLQGATVTGIVLLTVGGAKAYYLFYE